jgi:hypothetical protein
VALVITGMVWASPISASLRRRANDGVVPSALTSTTAKVTGGEIPGA